MVVVAEREPGGRDARAQRREPLSQGLCAGAVDRTLGPWDDEARHAENASLLDHLVERSVEALEFDVPAADLEPRVVEPSAELNRVVRWCIQLARLIALRRKSWQCLDGVDRAKGVELDREAHQAAAGSIAIEGRHPSGSSASRHNLAERRGRGDRFQPASPSRSGCRSRSGRRSSTNFSCADVFAMPPPLARGGTADAAHLPHTHASNARPPAATRGQGFTWQAGISSPDVDA